MKRGASGTWLPSVAAGENCRAFVPHALPPEPPLEFSPELREKWEAAHLALGRLDSVSLLLPDAALFLYSYVRQEAVLSSQIEGTQSSLTDLLLYENDGAPGVPLDDVREVSCYVDALLLGVQRIREGWPIATPVVLELHRTLLSHGRGAGKAPGAFRTSQNWLGGRTPSQAVFVPPPPQEVTRAWSDLEKFINDVPQRTSPLLKAALCHVQYETIHPFLDGNGRLGRLLIVLVLLKEKVLSEPLLYLSLFFKENRGEYYERLQKVREDGDWEGWLAFFADAVIETVQGATQTIRDLHALMARDAARLGDLGRLSASAERVLRALCERPVNTAPALQKQSALSLPTVNKSLSALTDLGIVGEMTGQKRGRIFVYQEYLDVLNRGVSSER